IDISHCRLSAFFLSDSFPLSFSIHLCVSFTDGRSQTLHQTPRFISLPPGSKVHLDCYLQGYNAEPWMYWYRQPPQGGALHMLFLSRSKDLIDDSLEKHFIAARPDQQNFTLSTDSLFPNDTGLYYCAWSRTLSQAGAAPGQKLPLPLSL
uniref:Ig-like domain-containing protein n=1 Tax=Terrapene triunguis TaxID=2587831 RepID=A0A674ILT4_9SAUR